MGRQIAAALLVDVAISMLIRAVQPSRIRGGASTDVCGSSHRADYGALVLDLTLRGTVRGGLNARRADEGDLAAALLVAHELADAGLKVAVGSFSFDLAGNAKREGLHERHHRRLVRCLVPLMPRDHPPPTRSGCRPATAARRGCGRVYGGRDFFGRVVSAAVRHRACGGGGADPAHRLRPFKTRSPKIDAAAEVAATAWWRS